MKDDKVISIFDRHLAAGTEAMTSSTASHAIETYQAAIIERTGKRAWSIRIYYNDGVIEQISYSHRKYDLSLSPDRLGISFTTGAVLMTGKNLRLLLDDLQDERVRSLQPFDPSRHKTPKDTEPIIYTIKWVSSTELEKHSSPPQESV